MIERNGKAFCLYAGLLDEAHQQGLKQIRTTLLQIPTDENGNVAICQSEVMTEKGVFTGLGDAAPQNVARAMQTCLIRMAETRAKARALRDAVNVGVVAIEELDSEGQAEAEEPGRGHGRGNPVRMTAGPIGPAVVRTGGGARLSTTRPSEPRPSAAEDERAESRAVPAVRPQTRSGFEDAASDASRGNADPMTPAQRRMLGALAEQAGEPLALDGLTRRQASQLIDEMKARIGQARAA